MIRIEIELKENCQPAEWREVLQKVFIDQLRFGPKDRKYNSRGEYVLQMVDYVDEATRAKRKELARRK